MTNFTSIEFDIAYDYFDDGSFEADMKERALAWELIELVGPAGGNPLVKIIGNKDTIYRLLEETYGQTDDEIEEFYPQLLAA